jgi:hypothetical protein
VKIPEFESVNACMKSYASMSLIQENKTSCFRKLL